jgi:hypothetical protein
MNYLEIEKRYKGIYYFKDFCKINIDYFNDLYNKYDDKKEIVLEYISLNKAGFYTIEGQKGKMNKIYKKRQFVTGFLNKNNFPYFKEYLSNRGDIFFDFKSYNNISKYNFTNMIIDDSDLILKKEELEDTDTNVWKIEEEYESEKYTTKKFEEYKELCNELFFENLSNNYLIFFISDKNYNSNICIVKILLFLIEYSNYKIKEENDKTRIKHI